MGAYSSSGCTSVLADWFSRHWPITVPHRYSVYPLPFSVLLRRPLLFLLILTFFFSPHIAPASLSSSSSALPPYSRPRSHPHPCLYSSPPYYLPVLILILLLFLLFLLTFVQILILSFICFLLILLCLNLLLLLLRLILLLHLTVLLILYLLLILLLFLFVLLFSSPSSVLFSMSVSKSVVLWSILIAFWSFGKLNFTLFLSSQARPKGQVKWWKWAATRHTLYTGALLWCITK